LTTEVSIAIDAMSGDFGIDVSVPGTLQALRLNQSVSAFLIGDQKQVIPRLDHDLGLLPHSERESISSRLHVIHTESVVNMSDKPTRALRQKNDSSMAKALYLVKSGEAEGCVSAGNTGALMVLSRAILGMFAGIDRPAIIKQIPTSSGHTYILDLGANVDSQAEHLYQFGVMGSLLVEGLGISQSPKIALLNIGEEEYKGSECVKLAAQLFSENTNLNYVGYIEGDDIFFGSVNVIVCDGFVGNVALKTSEGLARFFTELLQLSFKGNAIRRMLGWLVKSVLRTVVKKIDPALHNGAVLLGVQGVVVKSHGATGINGFAEAIQMTINNARLKLPEKINLRLDELLI